MDPTVRKNEIRVALIGARNQIQTSLAARDAYIRQGAAAGIGKVELAELAGVSRQTVYDILAKESQR